ncbi:hypothetical protein BD414DRAFT_103522 [Trametes punicea]|nr:hypothetical protein BD414DRAFT_103522 [Trametes punicea]
MSLRHGSMFFSESTRVHVVAMIDYTRPLRPGQNECIRADHLVHALCGVRTRRAASASTGMSSTLRQKPASLPAPEDGRSLPGMRTRTSGTVSVSHRSNSISFLCAVDRWLLPSLPPWVPAILSAKAPVLGSRITRPYAHPQMCSCRSPARSLVRSDLARDRHPGAFPRVHQLHTHKLSNFLVAHDVLTGFWRVAGFGGLLGRVVVGTARPQNFCSQSAITIGSSLHLLVCAGAGQEGLISNMRPALGPEFLASQTRNSTTCN